MTTDLVDAVNKNNVNNGIGILTFWPFL